VSWRLNTNTFGLVHFNLTTIPISLSLSSLTFMHTLTSIYRKYIKNSKVLYNRPGGRKGDWEGRGEGDLSGGRESDPLGRGEIDHLGGRESDWLGGGEGDLGKALGWLT
jgi:hypothetical protein